MVQVSITVGLICWVITAFLLATMLGAMFSPDKEKLTTRIILSTVFFIPCVFLVPLSFAAFFLLATMCFIIGITIFGVRTALELLVDGIPEMDDEGNIIQKETPVPPTAPWV
jgi:hypothetical protein|tara:strand:- start:436 stop:771 length:336 start_codon:yes stop_codon:yes gene_type:complete